MLWVMWLIVFARLHAPRILGFGTVLNEVFWMWIYGKVFEYYTPPKFGTVEPEKHGFQKGLSFSRDLFSGSMLKFGGVPLLVNYHGK